MPKPTKQDYIDLFNMSIDTSGWNPEYDKLLKRLFGRNDFSGNPDVDLFIDDHKKDPDGAEKFAKYMLRQRPSGRYWMKRERPKTDAQMKDIFKKESIMINKSKLIESAIRKIVNKVRNESKPLNEAPTPKFKSDDPQHQYDMIAKLTGTRSSAVKKFIEDNRINSIALMTDIGRKKLSAIDFVTAIAGNPNNRYFEDIVSKYQQNESKVNKTKKLTEAVSGVNFPLPNCNLFVKGWGVGSNGSMRILVGFPNDKAFPIQTNQNLPETHWTLQRAHRELSESELEVIGSEVLSYVQKFGPATVKSRLKVYGK